MAQAPRLGATHVNVVALVVRQALAMTSVGVAIGCGLAYFLTSVLATVLYATSPRDPIAFGDAAMLLGVLALVASYIPARRAAAVDPLTALRAE
jgi:putative ABC transport system permease protein